MAIAAWKLDLNGILQVFNVCSPCPRLVTAVTIPFSDHAGYEYPHHSR